MNRSCGDIEDLFLSILRQDADKDRVDGLFRHFGGDDWRKLYDYTVENYLSSAFYDRLTGLKLKNIPPDILSRFKNLYIANLRRSLLLGKELFDALRRFKESGIPVIPLKGYALARYIYDDIAPRNASCDLDLLVHREDLEEAERIIEEMGYRFAGGGKSPEFWHNYRREMMFQKRSDEVNSLLLDLHWDFRNRFVNTHIGDFWFNAKGTDVDGVRISMPSNEDLLIYLVLTALSDVDFVQLKYLYDLHALVMRFGKDMDWKKVTEKVSGLGLRTALYFSLYLSKEIFGTSVPEEVLNGARPGPVKRPLCKLIINKTNVVKSGKEIASRWSWRHVVSHYVLTDSVIDCVKIYLDKIFPPMGEVMGMYNQPVTKRSYYIYAKKLLKPLRFNRTTRAQTPTCRASILK